jgi:hypothetical protein
MNRLFTMLFCLCLAGLGVWQFRTHRADEDQHDKPVEIPSRVETAQGATVLRLTEAESKAAGLAIAGVSGPSIPDAAVAWFEGKPWVYLEKSPLHFQRAAVTIRSYDSGRYAVDGLPPEARIVTRGAQVLLSEEQRGAGGDDL